MDQSATSLAPPAKAAPAPGTPRRPALGLGLAALLAVVALGGGGAFWYGLRERPHAGAGVEGDQASRAHDGEEGGSKGAGLPVDFAHPRVGGIVLTTTQAASVHAFEHAELFAKVSGYLKVQTVDIGDRVKLGQLLAVIEDPEVDKAVEQNEASLHQAAARVGVAQEKVTGAEADKAAAEAMVEQQQSEVAAKVSNQNLQRKQLARIEGLVRGNAVESKLQDEQQDRYEVATADLGVARATVLTAKAQALAKAALVSKARADLAEARTDVEIARANLDKAKVMQAYTQITSPYDGVVTRRSFHRGDFIRSASEGGAVPLLAVAVTDKVRVVVPIPDTDVPYLNRGDVASFQVVALPGETFTGVVSRYAETEDVQSRNMRTEVDLPNPDGRLREGMYGRMTVTLQAATKDALTIPSSALISSSKGKGMVFIIRDARAHKVEVKVTKDNGVEAEVLGGLRADDQVITRYTGTINEGSAVLAQAAPAAGPAAH